ncbi:hypothetical protein ANCCAN_28629 [Ancylostoma caninum]|uniref:Uncharacterized protein n=1 Tax=Ancylostoma caninum TaxID=29170 RepID=A0A368F0Q1_ANCCA|nr:hypothetical protein ANCCAN_28629 [Ancylostoma caninum]
MLKVFFRYHGPNRLNKDNEKTTAQNLDEAFKSQKEKSGKRLRQIRYEKISRYGYWGNFHQQIYSELSVLCVYDWKAPESKN